MSKVEGWTLYFAVMTCVLVLVGTSLILRAVMDRCG